MPNPLLLSLVTIVAATAQVPEIISIDPLDAVPGEIISLRGDQFDSRPSSNIVFFGPVRGEVTEASLHHLRVKVPLGAVYGPVSVSVGGLTADSPHAFSPASAVTSVISSNTFAERYLTTNSLASDPFLATGDLNNDGKTDLVVGFALTSGIWIYPNNHPTGLLVTNSFTNRIQLWTRNPVGQFIVRDFDGDGKLDIVAQGNNYSEFYLFKNRFTRGLLATNDFISTQLTNVFTSIPLGGFAAGDIDRDGLPDLVVPGRSGAQILPNISRTNALRFGPAVLPYQDPRSPLANISQVKIADLDEDGSNEIIGAGAEIQILAHVDRTGVIRSNSFSVPFYVRGSSRFLDLAIADLDCDGLKDLAISSSTVIQIFRQESDLSLSPFPTRVDLPVSGTGQLEIADLDSDGRPEIVTIGGFQLILRNLCEPGLLTEKSFVTVVGPQIGYTRSFSILDIDRDTLPDILIPTGRGVIAMQNVSGRDLQLVGVRRANSRSLQILLSGQPYERVQIEKSADLLTWRHAYTGLMSRTGETQVGMSSQNDGMGFFRLVQGQ